MNYKLLTPGPLTTTQTVKEAMLVDHCTWDKEYKTITSDIREQLLEIGHCSSENYTVVLMQGSGSFGVESVLSSVVGEKDKLLIITNGAYGNRMEEMAHVLKLNFDVLSFPYNEVPDARVVAQYLSENPENTHIAIVHCETTTGILNDIASVSEVAKAYGQTYIVDAMSSFGGIDIQVEELGIDYLISSANKCIQGVPGFSFVLAKTEKLLVTKGQARSLSLSLYDQWLEMNVDGKWRYTSPTHVVLAFAQALKELKGEGGVLARNLRYQNNMNTVRTNFEKIGIQSYLDESVQSPIIATFEFPKENFAFDEMYAYIKECGYAIYPGKLLGLETFRIGVIGEIYKEDIELLTQAVAAYMESKEVAMV